MGSGMLSLAAGPEKAPTAVDAFADSAAAHDVALQVLELDSEIQRLRDLRDDRKGWLRGLLLRHDRKSVTYSDCSVRLAPAVEPICKCHRGPIVNCCNASQGLPVLVEAQQCEPYVTVKRR